MDPADSDFLKQVFRENNDLRVKYSALQRDLFNKTVQCENMEEELRSMYIKLEDAKYSKSDSKKVDATDAKGVKREISTPFANKNLAKDLEEALFAIDRQNSEISQYKTENTRLQGESREKGSVIDSLNGQLLDLQRENQQLRDVKQRAISVGEEMAVKSKTISTNPDDLQELQEKLDTTNAMYLSLKQELIDYVQEANRIQNGQQNQLQGYQVLLETVRSEYEEFIQTTKFEYDSFKTIHQQEYDTLKKDFEETKTRLFEEKKETSQEYRALLFNMQGQYEDYRKTSEFLFSSELVKLGEELSLQANRYEQEIMYVIQAKDKFYSDMMVAKDAKIMSLIEGSDLQSVMQKHELDLESVRKEHAKEIERIKTDHETESKNIIALLQRQNTSLESKCDKLQSHLKVLEGRMKELMSTVEQKNKLLMEKEELLLKMEAELQTTMDEMNAKLNALSQEKEHLRHKVIRLNLDARGEGENTIQNMLKRITRETSELNSEFTYLGGKYDSLLNENQTLLKKLKDREKLVTFLESEVKRRTEEYQSMTRTFEEFLEGRAKQARKDRTRRLSKLASTQALEKNAASNTISNFSGERNVIKVHIPERDVRLSASNSSIATLGQMELERGNAYLKRFKNLSKAFATGDFRILPQSEETGAEKNLVGLWQKTALYTKLDEATTTVARLYGEQPKQKVTAEGGSAEPALYSCQDGIEEGKKGQKTPDVRVYNSADKKSIKKRIALTADPKKKTENNGLLKIGGVGINIE